MEKIKNIVIVGAGFGGITAALKLEKTFRRNSEYRIILVDRNDYQLYTPALYEVASISKKEAPAFTLKSIIGIKIEDILEDKNIIFIQGEFTGINEAEHNITLKDGIKLPYEFLILALGAETNYLNIPGLKKHSHPFNKFEDALRIRNAFETLLSKKGNLTIIVGGGGASGVELIAELSNFLCVIQKQNVEYQGCMTELVLVEASDDILPSFDAWMVRRTKKRLLQLGVKIMVNSPITSVTESEVFLKNGNNIKYDLLVWAGGVTGPNILKSLNLPLTTKNNLAVNEYLMARDKIYAIGDNAGFLDPRTSRPLPWNVPVAEAEARFAARDITRVIFKTGRRPYRPMNKYPYILAAGKKYAIADLLIIKLWGWLGWYTKLLVELRYFLFILPKIQAIKKWISTMRMYGAND